VHSDEGLDDLESFSPSCFERAVRTYVLTGELLVSGGNSHTTEKLTPIADEGLDNLESFSPFCFECAVRTYVLTGGLSTSDRETDQRSNIRLLVCAKSPTLSL
jgi:hypothetical protein